MVLQMMKGEGKRKTDEGDTNPKNIWEINGGGGKKIIINFIVHKVYGKLRRGRGWGGEEEEDSI